MRLKADLTLLAVAIIWGTAFVAQTFAAQYRSAYIFNGLGFVLAALLLIPFIPKNNRISGSQWKWMFITGAVLLIASALQQFGLFYTKVANAGFLTSLYTVFTPFGLLIFFKEKPSYWDIAAVLLAGLGAFFLSTGGHFQIQPGDTLEVTGAFFWTFHILILGKIASKFEPISFSVGQFLVCGIINLIIGYFVEDYSIVLIPVFIGAVLYRSILSITIGYTLQVCGQRHTPPTDAALILSLESVFAAIAGWFILKDLLQPIQIIGCAIIFGAVIISQIKPYLTIKKSEQLS